MKIKTGDNVKVLSGRAKGSIGKVLQVLTNKKNGLSYVVVEGANMRKKHLRGRGNEKGRTIEYAAPIHASSVMFIEAESKKPTRVGYRREGEKKVRFAKKTGQVI